MTPVRPAARLLPRRSATAGALARGLKNALTSAPRGELNLMSGCGGLGEPCEAISAHGYKGIEKETVAAISAWILDPTRDPNRPKQ